MALLPKVDLHTGASSPLTHGLLTVTSLLAWDLARGVLYFTAIPAVAPHTSHVYSTSTSPSPTLPAPSCVSCSLSSCSWATASLPPSGDHLLLSCLGPDTPHHLLLPLHPPGPPTPLNTQSDLPPLALPTPQLLSLPLAPDLVVRARLLLPPDLRPSSGGQHPLLLLLPGQPGSHSSTSRWRVDLASLLASALGVGVLQVLDKQK